MRVKCMVQQGLEARVKRGEGLLGERSALTAPQEGVRGGARHT